jgi:NDP-4-keto-2,6-dideoxyhexose 3-C-methyltransferase
VKITEKTECRVCGLELPNKTLLSLGTQNIVDFVKKDELGRGQAPLDLVQCINCDLLQLRHTVDADTLFKKFWYRSGINEQMKAALKDVVFKATSYTSLRKGDVVCDIGSNDGTLLSLYDDSLIKVGFEPAKELAMEAAEKTKCTIVNGYFDSGWNFDKPFKIITAIAMFYDLDEPGKFLDDVVRQLHDDGVFIVQMNYLPTMMRNLAFDNIGHEHLCYYSLATLSRLFALHKLIIVDAELNGVNGGSIRVYAKKHFGFRTTSAAVDDILRAEGSILTEEHYKIFAERVNDICEELKEFLGELKKRGKKVYAYGASTRGSTLLQTVFKGEFGSKYLEGVAERDPNKFGLYMVGLDLQIVDESEARSKADYFLLLPYHFWESISQREQEWMSAGGKFILPVPYLKVVALATMEGSEGKLVPYAVDLPEELESLGSYAKHGGL